MAQILALVPDLLFGSKVQSMLQQAGHAVDLVSSETEVWAAIGTADVLVVDLTTDELDGVVLVDTLLTGGEMGHARTLGFCSHVEPKVKRRAEAAGFDLVVPRSRMNREGAELVTRLAAGA